MVFLDESIVDRWAPTKAGDNRAKTGKRILVGAVVTPATSDLERVVTDLHNDLLADPTHWDYRGAADRLELSAKEGLHFAQDSPRMREAAVQAMRTQDFRAHIYHANLEDSGLSAEHLQTVMYFNLLRTLMLRYSGLRLALVFENCQSMNALFGRVVLYAARSLDRATKHEKRPRASVTAALGYKPHGGLSTIDYCLGVANLQVQSEHDDGKDRVRDFELEMVGQLNLNIAHVVDFGAVVHRRRFPILERPRWVTDIRRASSPSDASRPFSTLISSSPTGPFTHRRTIARIALALGLTLNQFDDAVRMANESASYSFHKLKKKGKERTFITPKAPLLALAQGRTADFLRPFNEFLHPACIGYVPGRRTLDAATPHSGSEWIQKLDIADYYSSTSYELIQTRLVECGATDDVASALASLVTWEGALPTGTRTSPVVSNIVMADFDYACAAFAEKLGLAYTRYADDLIFSGSQEFNMEPWVSGELRKLGYQLNPGKSRLRKRGEPIRIAGLTVFEPDRPRLPKALKRRLRLEVFLVDKDLHAQIFDLKVDDEEDAPAELVDAWSRLSHARGMLRYAHGVEPAFTSAVLKPYSHELRRLLRPQKRSQQNQSQLQLLLQRILATRAEPLGRTPLPIGERSIGELLRDELTGNA